MIARPVATAALSGPAVPSGDRQGSSAEEALGQIPISSGRTSGCRRRGDASRMARALPVEMNAESSPGKEFA